MKHGTVLSLDRVALQEIRAPATQLGMADMAHDRHAGGGLKNPSNLVHALAQTSAITSVIITYF